MGSGMAKVLHRVGGLALIGHVARALVPLAPARVILVTGPDGAPVADTFAAAAPALPLTRAIQHERKGTGHGVRTAAPALAGFTGDVLVVFGDTPLLEPQALQHLIEARRAGAWAVAVAAMRPADRGAYGRVVLDDAGQVERIVEANDASPAEAALALCNGGVMALDGARLMALLTQLSPANAKGEYYLTDVVAHARAAGWTCGALEVDAASMVGINTRAELAQVEALFQARQRAQALAQGVTLVAPETVWFSYDTILSRDVVVEPHVVFGPGVQVGEGAQIKAFSHLEGARIDAGAQVGPFARVRAGTVLGKGAKVGNFVELKAAVLGEGAKVNHLSYVGDAQVGAKANVGAGTITCNYDGFAKASTVIGAGAFIGSNSALVAPVSVGAGAIVGAGSVITKDVAADALALARAVQSVKPGGAAAFRARRAAAKLKAGPTPTKRGG
jgi:bifunctional UDP-N-acetylglucosamine pyrophosphorylase / glucosamine-1-phosphate N-acetyltransferase